MMRGGLGGAPVTTSRGALGTGTAAAASAPRAWPDLLLLLVAAVIFTYIWRLHNVVAAAQALRPTALLGLAIAAACVSVPLSLVGRRLASSVLALLMLLTVVAAAGIPFALDPAATTSYVTGWIMPGVLLALVVAISARSTGDVEWLLLATVVGAAVFVLILYARGGVNAVTNSEVTVFYDRNELALMLVVLLPAVVHFMRAGEPAVRRAFALGCFLLFVFTIVRGGSRGGLVGLSAVLGYVLLTFRTVPRSTRVAVAAGAVLLLAGGGAMYWARMRTILQPTADYNVSASYGRAAIWQRGLRYVRERPLAGVGASGFAVAEHELSPLARRRIMAGRPVHLLNAHNIFVQVAAELGLPGLVVFVALLVQMARTLRRVRRGRDRYARTPAVAQVLLAALLGYVVCGFFLSAAYFPFLFLLIGLVAALAAIARSEEPLTRQWDQPRRAVTPPATRGGGVPAYEVPAPARW